MACDTDPVAMEIAGEGFVGSVDAVAGGAMDLVMANISPEAIARWPAICCACASQAECFWRAASKGTKWNRCARRCRDVGKCGKRASGR